jgi:hypothetical protein
MIRRAVNEVKLPVKLMYLTNEFMRSELVSKLYITNGNLVSNIEGETTLDESLNKEQTMGALKNWVELMSLKHKDASERWKSVIQTNLSGLDCDTRPWPVQKRYLTLLREACEPYVPTLPPHWKITQLWTLATQWVADQKEIQVGLRLDSLSELTPSSWPHPNPTFDSFRHPPPPPSTTPLQSALLQPLHLGAKGRGAATRGTNGGRGGGSQQSRGNGKGAAPLAQSSRPARAIFCMACGDPAHNARDCPAQVQVNGNPIRLIKQATGEWKWPDNLPFCWNFNNPNGCSYAEKDCIHKRHACSRCLLPEHNATVCPGTSG